MFQQRGQYIHREQHYLNLVNQTKQMKLNPLNGNRYKHFPAIYDLAYF